MDYHQSNDNNEWDRWNSSAENSSYHNQPTHPPYDRAFSVASMIMGMFSITFGCCGLAIPFGALGILFALLSHRKKKAFNSNAAIGICLSVIGLSFGVGILLYTLVQLPALLKDPATINQLNQLYQSMFGMDFQEYLQSTYTL